MKALGIDTNSIFSAVRFPVTTKSLKTSNKESEANDLDLASESAGFIHQVNHINVTNLKNHIQCHFKSANFVLSISAFFPPIFIDCIHNFAAAKFDKTLFGGSEFQNVSKTKIYHVRKLYAIFSVC